MKAGLRIEETQTNKITEIFLATVVTTVYYGVITIEQVYGKVQQGNV